MLTPALVETHLEDSSKTIQRDPFWVYADIFSRPGFDSVTSSEIVTASSVRSDKFNGREVGKVIIDFSLNERVSLGSVCVVPVLLAQGVRSSYQSL